MSAERLLSLYDQKILHCSKLIKTMDYEIELVKGSYEEGLLKSKRIYNHYIKKAENKKSEYLKLQDEYFRRMDFIKSQKAIFS